MFESFVDFVQELYGTRAFIPLHEPRFTGNERAYVLDAIDSTYVSSVGAYVDRFEHSIAQFTGAGYTVATVNGTAALHIALLLAGVGQGDEVVTQSLTFAATTAAIRYCSANPVFVDIDRESLGMSPESLKEFLSKQTRMVNGICRSIRSGAAIRACLPMHTFGHPVNIGEIRQLCDQYRLVLIEDAAESLGSLYRGKHTGTFGALATLSFNGNKIITTGGGGMILTDDPDLAGKARHLTTTAKKKHPWAYEHDAVGYNYRLPNLNAALGVAQAEQLPTYIAEKRRIAAAYRRWCATAGVHFVLEPEGCQANYWLNALLLNDRGQRDNFLQFTNQCGVMTRPAWQPMHLSAMYRDCQQTDLTTTEWVYDRLVNVPSSVCLHAVK